MSMEMASKEAYDAIIVPGGGIDPETGAPRPWVAARLDAAIQLDLSTRYYVVLSRGTTHRPPPTNDRGFPIDEAASSAAYLVQHGISDTSRILIDSWSLDTIGNAFFARTMIAEPIGLHKLLVITSSFHMPRTRAIFDWVFALPSVNAPHQDPPAVGFSIDYLITDDVGMDREGLADRMDKEQSGLRNLQSKTIPRITTLGSLASFMAVDHDAYNAKNAVQNTRVAKHVNEPYFPTVPAETLVSKAKNTY